MFPNPTDDPIVVFTAWLAGAKADKAIGEPTAMCLASTTPEGAPSARMVLLKGVDARGFVFFTNYESRKGTELDKNPQAAACFYWQKLGRQVRVTGGVERVSAAESDEYFASRPRDARIGAWASAQSRPLEGGIPQLMADVAKAATQYGIGEVPRPPHWGGYRIIPGTIEFWEEGRFRLHKRLLFSREGGEWRAGSLYP